MGYQHVYVPVCDEPGCQVQGDPICRPKPLDPFKPAELPQGWSRHRALESGLWYIFCADHAVQSGPPPGEPEESKSAEDTPMPPWGEISQAPLPCTDATPLRDCIHTSCAIHTEERAMVNAMKQAELRVEAEAAKAMQDADVEFIHELAQQEAPADSNPDVTMLNVVADDCKVFALLSDNRVLSKELEDKRCAEEHRDQLLRLNEYIDPSKLVAWYGWKELTPAEVEQL